MKIALCLLFAFITITGICQKESWEKVRAYRTNDGRLFSEEQKDSITDKAKLFVSTKTLKETPDTIFHSLVYFDYSEMPVRYQTETGYSQNNQRVPLPEVMKRFPFNKTAKVKLVSFKPIPPDSFFFVMPKRSNGAINFDQMFEVKTISKELIEKIADILINFKPTIDARGQSLGCYDPRNAIIFIDKSDKIIGHIEICFECIIYLCEPPMEFSRPLFREKLEVLRGIFISAGIDYGAKTVEDWTAH